MSKPQYRICREPKDIFYYVEKFIEGEGYPVTVKTNFRTIPDAQLWIDNNREHVAHSYSYTGEWQ